MEDEVSTEANVPDVSVEKPAANQGKGKKLHINFSFSNRGVLTYSFCVKGFYFMYLNQYPKHLGQLLLKLVKSLTHLNGNIIKTNVLGSCYIFIIDNLSSWNPFSASLKLH